MLLSIENLSFGWHDELLFENVDCQLNFGEMVVLLGDNGTGKTTMLKLMAGMIPHFSRGKRLEGDILVLDRSIIQNSPKSFFMQIAYLPSRNVDFFLLTTNMEEETALVEGILQSDDGDVRQRKEKLYGFFPDLDTLWEKSFSTMNVYQKNLCLLSIHFLQGAILFLIDDIWECVPGDRRKDWQEFFNHLLGQGCGIIFTSHESIFQDTTVWKIAGNSVRTG